MRKLLPAAVFVTIFVAHALYVGYCALSVPLGWTDDGIVRDAAGYLGLGAYLRGHDYFIGFSYGLGAAFATWALSHCIFAGRERGVAAGAVAGAITLVGILMAGGCFLIGCCGSPMLTVYLALFGAQALGLGKPLTALMTLASVSFAYWRLSRRFARGDACCSPTNTSLEIAGTGRSKVGTTTHKR